MWPASRRMSRLNFFKIIFQVSQSITGAIFPFLCLGGGVCLALALASIEKCITLSLNFLEPKYGQIPKSLYREVDKKIRTMKAAELKQLFKELNIKY